MILLSDLEGMSKTPAEAKEHLAKFEQGTELNWELHPSLPHKVNCGPDCRRYDRIRFVRLPRIPYLYFHREEKWDI